MEYKCDECEIAYACYSGLTTGCHREKEESEEDFIEEGEMEL